jgi:uncharacterized protein (TIGR03085 family)
VTSIAAYERQHLADLADELGPGAPTLCGDWSVKDLVVHLLVRERSLAAIGITVSPLSGLVDRAMERRSREDFATLVEQLRQGPPVYSVFAVPKLGSMLNLLEYFVHHEDVRRAQPGWQPRTLPAKVEDALWKAIRHAGRGLVVGSPVGVVAERSDTGEQATFKGGEGVVLRGLPSEITLHAYGRRPQSHVEVSGSDEAVMGWASASPGI